MQLRLAFLLIVFIHGIPTARAEVVAVEVSAGEWDRTETLVHFPLPGFKNTTLGLRSKGGLVLPLQVDRAGVATFILPKLAKGKAAFFDLVTENPRLPPVILVKRAKDKLRISHQGKTILEYQAEPGALPRKDIDKIYARGGYLHPVYTPKGKLVTDDFPLQHTHHHGIWFPWTKAEFEGRHPDFWNMGDGSARVDFLKLETNWSGAVHGGFVARHRFMDLTAKPKPKAVIEETWEVRVYAIIGNAKPKWIFDLTSTQWCSGASPLILPQYRYGGLGVRGNREWDQEKNNPTVFQTANGVTDRLAGHATRARWCYMGGKVDGAQAGLTILGHPRNFRAPQPMRIHPKEPFFNFAPQQFGSMAIRPGEKYVSRYRFVVADGAPIAGDLHRIWADFAHPPEVRIRKR